MVSIPFFRQYWSKAGTTQLFPMCFKKRGLFYETR